MKQTNQLAMRLAAVFAAIGLFTSPVLSATTGPATSKRVAPDNKVAPDNSEMNTIDRNENALNAQKQGDSPADVETTRAIREKITSNKDLSTYAHNIKIVTQNGQVTLIGPVRSQQEKVEAEKAAKAVAGAAAVVNQLTIAQ